MKFHERFEQDLREKPDPLMHAGMRLLTRRGYDETRVADIARTGGIAVGSFYSRFASKQAFFAALEADLFRRARQNLDRFIDAVDPEWTSDQLIAQIVRYVMAGTQRNLGYVRMVLTLRDRGIGISPAARSFYRYRAKRIAALLAEHVRDETHIGIAVEAIANTVAVEAFIAPEDGREPDETLVAAMTEMLRAYLHIPETSPQT